MLMKPLLKSGSLLDGGEISHCGILTSVTIP